MKSDVIVKFLKDILSDSNVSIDGEVILIHFGGYLFFHLINHGETWHFNKFLEVDRFTSRDIKASPKNLLQTIAEIRTDIDTIRKPKVS
jgi:hypothetical protein